MQTKLISHFYNFNMHVNLQVSWTLRLIGYELRALVISFHGDRC